MTQIDAGRTEGLTTLARRRISAQGLQGLAFRFLVAVDVAGFSQRYAAEQARVQDDLETAMSQAAASVGLERERWYRQPRGDGELAVLPQGVDGLSLVADYPSKLASSIAEINRANHGPRLRVRLAIHHGAVAPGLFGPVGGALVAISRLVESEAVRQQLRQRSDMDIAMIVSATVYNEVIQSRLRDLDPEPFRRVVIRAKGISYVGHLCQSNLGLQVPEFTGAREATVSLLPLAMSMRSMFGLCRDRYSRDERKRDHGADSPEAPAREPVASGTKCVSPPGAV